MDWLKKIPIGQYVSGDSSWLRNLDPRLKFCWVSLFLLSPVLASSYWRLLLVFGLLFITFLSCLPLRVWWRSLCIVMILSGIVGLLAMFLPTGEVSSSLAARSPTELPNALIESRSWIIVNTGSFQFGPFLLGPLTINRRSAELGLNTSTLIFTVVHSVNLMLITTSPEDLMWSINWFLSPLALIGVPIKRLSFQLLLSLRFLPLIQEEFQNLLRSLSTRSLNIRKLGFKATLALFLSLGEKLLLNILLRAEQGADAFLSRGGRILPPDHFIPSTTLNGKSDFLNISSTLLLLFVVILRRKYGAI